jgi:hypothetical protein
VIFDEKLKVHNDAGISLTRKTKTDASPMTRKHDTMGSQSSRSKNKISRPSVMKANAVIPGWNKNDHNMIRIMSGYLKANVDYYYYQSLIKQKTQDIKKVIDFASDIMHVKNYRDLSEKVSEHCQSIIGFNQCSIFFHNSDSDELFAVTKVQPTG